MHATWYYKSRTLREGDLKEACERVIAEVLDPKAKIRVGYPRRGTRQGVKEDTIYLDAESLRAIIDLSKIDLSLDVESGHNPYAVMINIRAVRKGEFVEGYAYGTNSAKCLEQIALRLALERVDNLPDEPNEWDGLPKRVAALERVLTDRSRRLKCFISFKFEDSEVARQVGKLKRMLDAIGVDWVSGEQFEPRRIEDKVSARLRADVDFVIAVISKAGPSDWIRDELGDANARSLYLMILVEEGATFEGGMFGTLEYIRYDKTIEQTFTAVLEGINFVKADVRAKSGVPDTPS